MRRTLIDISDLTAVAREHGPKVEILDRQLPECALPNAERMDLCERLELARNAGKHPILLQHRLSPYSTHLDCDVRAETSNLEHFSYIAHSEAISLAFRDRPSGLKDLLVKLGSAAGANSRIRASQSRTIPDKDGRAVLFPDSSMIDSRLDEICQMVASQQASRSLKAIAVLCCVLNLHPLSDGNGRTARILFNALLNVRCEDDCYLPLYDIKQASLFGFEFSLRELELTGNWDPLLSYFVGICDFMRRYREEIA